VSDPRAAGAAALLAVLRPGHRLGLAVLDPELRTLAVSPSLPAMAGAASEPAGGRPLAAVLPSGTERAIAAGLAEVRDRTSAYAALSGLASGEPDGRLYRAGCYRLGPERGSALGLALADTTEAARTDTRLRANRARLATVERLARLGVWTWLRGPDRWTWSEQLFHLAGREPSAVAPRFGDWVHTLAPESRGPVVEAARRARSGVPFDLTFAQLRPDGSRRVLRGWAEPTAVDGQVVRIDGVVQDVTGIQRAAGQHQAVAELGRAALAGEPVDALLERAAALVGATLALDHVTVVELQPDRGLVIRTTHGWQDVDGLGGVPPSSQAAFAVRTGEPVVVEDWSAEDRFSQSPLLAAARICSGVAVPIRGPGTPFGVLSAHSTEPYAVSDEDVAFLGAVANVLGSAVERLRLEAELSEQAAARGRLVAQALDAEDRTRREISETLHDGPLQDVLALHQHVARLEPAAETDAAPLERARTGLARAIVGLRDVMLELHPVILDVGGLESALGAIAAQQAQIGGFVAEVRIDPTAHGVRDELILSLARELLINAAKHSGAGRVDVSVRRDRAGLVLEVADDGCGIAEDRPAAALGEGHVGLASIRQRVDALSGRLAIASGPDDGTRVRIELPI
jgi:signal transduction histidine kinase/PAS domain-containing protein